MCKCLSIVCMILCHTVTEFASFFDGYEADFGYVFAEELIGGLLTGAYIFMFAMGMGMVYTRNNTPKAFMRRGIKLLLLGYILNAMRYGIFTFIAYRLGLTTIDTVLLRFFETDILFFAGLAFLLIGLLKKFKLNNVYILLVSLALSVIGSFASVTSDSLAINHILGLFMFTSPDVSYFPLFNWLITVAAGMVFGDIIRRTKNPDRLYARVGIVSGIVSVTYIVLSVFVFGYWFLSKNSFYAFSTAEGICFICITLLWLSIFHFIGGRPGPKLLTVISSAAKNVNLIYCVHWCIIGFISFLNVVLFNISEKNYPAMYAMGFLIIIVSYAAALAVNKLKCRGKTGKKKQLGQCR